MAERKAWRFLNWAGRIETIHLLVTSDFVRTLLLPTVVTAAWRWSIRWCGRDKPRYAKMASLSVFGVGRQQFGRARITIIPGRVIRHIGNGQLPLSKQVARIHGAGQAIEKSGRIFRLRT